MTEILGGGHPTSLLFESIDDRCCRYVDVTETQVKVLDETRAVIVTLPGRRLAQCVLYGSLGGDHPRHSAPLVCHRNPTAKAARTGDGMVGAKWRKYASIHSGLLLRNGKSLLTMCRTADERDR